MTWLLWFGLGVLVGLGVTLLFLSLGTVAKREPPRRRDDSGDGQAKFVERRSFSRLRVRRGPYDQEREWG